jgi:hypothetical protein
LWSGWKYLSLVSAVLGEASAKIAQIPGYVWTIIALSIGLRWIDNRIERIIELLENLNYQNQIRRYDDFDE